MNIEEDSTLIQQIRSSYFVIFHSVYQHNSWKKSVFEQTDVWRELNPLEGDYTFYSTPDSNIPSSVNEILTSLESWLLLLLLVVSSLWFRVILKSPARTRISTFKLKHHFKKCLFLSRGYIYIDQSKWYVDLLYIVYVLAWSNGVNILPKDI